MKLAAVVQRYGPSVAGGAERLAREVCSRLSARDQVTVFTTTARDYITWRNELPSGREELDGVEVRRYPVAAERDPERFAAISRGIFDGQPSLDDELRWVREQGPDSPALQAALWHERSSYDAVLFFTYLYAPTLFGLSLMPERSVLVPLAHNEAPIYLRIFKNLFRLPARILFQTPEEQSLVARVVPRNPVPGEVVGYGTDVPGAERSCPWPSSVPGDEPYVLYLGRLDPSKGIPELLARFSAYRSRNPAGLRLVLAGEAAMKIPDADGVVATGFVSETERDRLLTHARLVVQPSRFESLSIVALEAWARGRAVLATSASEVLAGQITRSGGGWCYADEAGFESVLALAHREDPALARRGESGLAYVRATGSWEQVVTRYRQALESVAASAPRPRSNAN